MKKKYIEFRERLKLLAKTKKQENVNDSLRVDRIEDYQQEYENGYITYIDSQRPAFELIINLINDIISVLKSEGAISETSQMYARIKAYSSAKANHLKGKNLKDVFGIELIGATGSEKRYLSKVIDQMIKRKKGKQRKKT